MFEVPDTSFDLVAFINLGIYMLGIYVGIAFPAALMFRGVKMLWAFLEGRDLR